MLSITNIGLEHASTYYSKDNYYTKQLGEFRGKAMNNLGFSSELTHEHFIQMLKGQNSQGEQLRREKQTGKTRAGFDHTFSAPKSVSVLVEIAEAKGNYELANQLRAAHDRAVNAALSHIENNYIYTRSRKNGNREKIKTDNMVVAKFEHNESRIVEEEERTYLDPELHTHCVIANMTQLPNGKWQAINNEELYNNKILNGQYYRSELAIELKKMGVDIELTNSQLMLFEIKGIDQSLITEFSKRSQQIEAKMEEMRAKYPNASEAELKQYATLETRNAKKEVNRDQVREDNLQRAEKLVNTDKLLKNIKQENIKFKETNIKELIEKSAEIITENESVFSKEDILKIATKLSLGDVKASDIWQEIENTDLIKIDENQFTTHEILKKEKETIEYLQKTKDSKEAISTKEKAESYAKENYSTFTKGQAEAFTHIITSTDALIGIQGDAGSGKTYMLQALNNFTKDKNIELIGLAYTGQAADELQKDSGIQSHTLHSYLAKEAAAEDEHKKEKIYIVDEASLVGSKQLHELIQKAEKENAKIVLVGDTKQFQTISAGAIFDQLQQRGMATAEMLENIRQRESATLREVVKEIKDKNTDKAFEILKKSNSIVETGALHKQALEEYKKDNDILIIASTNKYRKEINSQIRAFKKKKGEIKNEQNVTVKESINILNEQKFFINNYQEGQLIFINKSANGLKAGSQGKIVDIDREKGLATLSFKNQGEETLKTIDISKVGDQLSIYQEKIQSFGIGDKITFTKNDKKFGVKNGNIGTITKLDERGNITVKIDNKEVNFNLKQYNYIDYGYAITDFKAQGQTAKNVAIVANSKMANIKSFYVQITRAKSKVKIITDNLKKLEENVTREVSKTTTLDYVTEQLSTAKSMLQKIKQNIHIKHLIEMIKDKIKTNIKEKENEQLRHGAPERANNTEPNHSAASERDSRAAGRDTKNVKSTGEREQRAEFERADTTANRNDRAAHKFSWKEAIAIAERGAKDKNQYKGVENVR